MKPNTPNKELYERYWEERQRHEERGKRGDATPNEILEAVESALHSGGRLLDVGCGNGGVIEVARERCKSVHGCDVSEVALRKACSRGVIGLCVDLNEGLPYRSGAFDWVTCLEVLSTSSTRSDCCASSAASSGRQAG